MSRRQLNIQLPHSNRKIVPALLHDIGLVLSLRKAHFERANQVRRNTAHLQHGEFLADTIVWASAEREERAPIQDSLGLFVGPTFREEGEWVNEVSWVALYAVRRHPHEDASGNVRTVWKHKPFWGSLALYARRDLCDVSKINRVSGKRRTNGWVETQGLIDDSVEKCAICYICHLQESLGWHDDVDLFTEFVLDL
jgi:hypothetical protein